MFLSQVQAKKKIFRKYIFLTLSLTNIYVIDYDGKSEKLSTTNFSLVWMGPYDYK